MCDWSSLPAGELGPVPFFGLKKDGLSCAVQPTGLLLCGDGSTPSTVFAEVGRQLNEVQFGRRDETTRVERLQPCYWYEDYGQTLCRQPMTDQTTTPVMLDALRTDGICTFGGGSYTSAPTPSVPDNIEDAVDLRLILYTLLTDENNVQQHQTILAKVPVGEDLVLETYLSDSAHNGVLQWQTTDKLVEPSLFQHQLSLVRDEEFNGLAVLTMAVMPGSGDTRSFEVKGSFPVGGTARLVRRHVVRRMDVTPDAPPDFDITNLITVAQEYVDLQTEVDEANKTLRDTWIAGLRQIVSSDIENDFQREYIAQTLHANMSELYYSNELLVRYGLRETSTTGHECSHEVHRLHMSPILYGACRDYTAPVVDTNGPVRTPRFVDGEDFVMPIPPSAMQSDAFAQGTMPDVYTPPRRPQTVESDYEVQQDHDVAYVVNNVPDFELLETLCVVLQGFPCNRTNMEEMLKLPWGEVVDHFGNKTLVSSVGRWITQRLFNGEPARSVADSPQFDLSMVDAVVRDWEVVAFDYDSTPSGDEVITAREIQGLMQVFFPNETWRWPNPVLVVDDIFYIFTAPILDAGRRIESWPQVMDLSDEQRVLHIKTGIIFNTLRYNVLDASKTVIMDDGQLALVWVGGDSSQQTQTTRRVAIGRLLALVTKGMFPEGPQCLLTEWNDCLCNRTNSINNAIGDNCTTPESTFLLVNQGEQNMYIPNRSFEMCDATAHQELLVSNREGKRGGPVNVMMLVLHRLYPDLYAKFLTFLSCRSVVDENPKTMMMTSRPSKGLRRPVVVHTARDDVCAELSEWNLGQNWELSAMENSLYITSCQLVEDQASHNVLRLVYRGLASETLRQDVCQRWGAFKTPWNAAPNFDSYATAHEYRVAQGLRVAATDASGDWLQAGVDSTMSVLPVRVHVHTDTVDLTLPENTASVHENQTLYEWFAMFDHTKDAHTFRINPVAQNHVYQYTGFEQPLLTPARDVVSTTSTSYAVIQPNNVPPDHRFLDKWKRPFQMLTQSMNTIDQPEVEAQWLTPGRNHLPPSQRQAAISRSRFDISPDFLAWRWNARAMASDTDSAEDIGRRIIHAEEGVAHLTRVATGQCGMVMERENAHVTSSPTLQWTRDEDGRTYQIDKNFNDPDHVLYVFRD
jgi:hypothetical protein